MRRATFSLCSKTPAPSDAGHDPVPEAVKEMLACGGAIASDCADYTAPDYSNLRRDGTLPKNGPGKEFKPVARIWCKDGAGQTVALHEVDIAILSFQDLRKYLYVQRYVMELRV